MKTVKECREEGIVNYLRWWLNQPSWMLLPGKGWVKADKQDKEQGGGHPPPGGSDV